MVTYHQLISKQRLKKIRTKRTLALQKNPQLKGVCLKVFTKSPRKPNSAIRKVARVRLSSGFCVSSYVPGIGHRLQEHSVVLVRGGRAQDLPGVLYRLVRGKYDLNGVLNRRTGRSKYGAKRISS